MPLSFLRAVAALVLLLHVALLTACGGADSPDRPRPPEAVTPDAPAPDPAPSPAPEPPPAPPPAPAPAPEPDATPVPVPEPRPPPAVPVPVPVPVPAPPPAPVPDPGPPPDATGLRHGAPVGLFAPAPQLARDPDHQGQQDQPWQQIGRARTGDGSALRQAAAEFPQRLADRAPERSLLA
jgi:outer membrane biosynthesis protein TonB